MAKWSPVMKLVNKFCYWMVNHRAFSCSLATNVEFLFSLVFLKKQFFIFVFFLSDVCLVSSDNFVVLSLQRTWRSHHMFLVLWGWKMNRKVCPVVTVFTVRMVPATGSPHWGWTCSVTPARRWVSWCSGGRGREVRGRREGSTNLQGWRRGRRWTFSCPT